MHAVLHTVVVYNLVSFARAKRIQQLLNEFPMLRLRPNCDVIIGAGKNTT